MPQSSIATSNDDPDLMRSCIYLLQTRSDKLIVSNEVNYRKGDNNDDALPLNAARRDAIANLKSCWGFESELQSTYKSNAVSFRFAVGRHVNAAYSDMDCRDRILRLGKISGPTLSHLLTKVQEILARRS